jgi:hypothetical protein
MKKTIYILFVLLLGLVSCVKELEPSQLLPKANETGLVAVTMELEIPAVQIQALTKAKNCSADPQIDYIKVAVFGISGYPQAYSLAEPVGSYATSNGTTYQFKVLLPVYEGEAHVHIIANGDESIKFVDETEASIMEKMSTSDNVGAFWTRIILKDGILPKKDVNGIMKTDEQGNFEPDTPTANAFTGLILIRNFAQVTLSVDQQASENLKDIHWMLVNVPTKGSVAPMAAGTYVDDYAAYTYNETTGRMVNGDEIYEGFMFVDEPMDNNYPATAAAAESAITTSPGTPLFMYERTHPGTEKATCLLVRAKFKPTNGQEDSYYTYYRIDLMDEAVGGYFPIYRNYNYKVKIHKVGNRGATSPAEAMNRDSGGNVSMSTEARKLTDISDGESRLLVEYVEKNFTSGGKKTLWVQYIPDVSTGVVNNTNVSVSIKTQGLALKEGTTVTKTAESSETGYNFYEFELNGQDANEDLVSVLQVIAHNGLEDDDRSTLYRDITLRVMKQMDMTLSLVPKKVDTGTGINTVLNIGLPDGLPSSMFPLEIYIEDINHTLNPTQQDGNGHAITMPVKTAKSLADGTTNSFFFIRTVNESEYTTNHTISTQFETMLGASATTIYVANEYFKTQSVNLLNDGIYVNPTQATVAFDVTSVDVQVEMDPDDQTKTWTVTAGDGVTVNVSSAQTGNGSFTMSFAANNSTTTPRTLTATVTSAGVPHTVTITQLPLQFSITPNTQTVLFNATTATVTIHAEEGKAWTASVSGPTGTNPTLSATSGEGTTTLTVTLPANTTTSQRTFTVTATMTNPAATATATITQRRRPNSSSTFNVNSFTYNDNRTGNATSNDGYINISLSNLGLDYGGYGDIWEYGYRPTDVNYIQMGYRNNNQNNRGNITITPVSGLKITQIKVTYSNATYAGYEFGNNPVTVTPGTFTRDGNNSSTATWTGSSTGAVTFTNGYQSNYSTPNFPRITSIQVTYEPI